jgi:hypothetical protein
VTATSAVVSLGSDDEAAITVSARAESILPWLALSISATQVGPVQEFRTSG